MEMEPDESFAALEQSGFNKSKSLNTDDREHMERDFVLNGYHEQFLGENIEEEPEEYYSPQDQDSGRAPSRQGSGDSYRTSSESSKLPLSRESSATVRHSVEGKRGHARDPLEEDHPYLFIGPSAFTGTMSGSDVSFPGSILDASDSWDNDQVHTPGPEFPVEESPIVSESPGAAEFDIYETAYREQIESIRKHSFTRRGTYTKVYLTRRVEGKDDVKKLVETLPQDEQGHPASEPGVHIGEKRNVPMVTPTVGLMKAQLEQQQQESSQSTNESLPEHQSSSPSGPNPTTNTRSLRANPRSRFRGLIGGIRRNTET